MALTTKIISSTERLLSSIAASIRSLVATRFELLVIFASALIIIPFISAAFFIHPYYDDFYFSDVIGRMGAWKYMIYFYYQWSGRYFFNFIFATYNAHIVNASNIYYVIYALLLIFGTFGSLVLLAHHFFYDKLRWRAKIMLASLVMAVYLAFIPEVFSSYYWHCASTYQFNLLLVILALSFLVKRLNNFSAMRWFDWILLFLLNMILGGSSEIVVISLAILYGGAALYTFFLGSKIWKLWLLLCAVIVVFGAIMLMAPGNFVRMENSAAAHETKNLLMIGGRTFYDLLIFHIIHSFFNSPVILLLLLSVPWIIQMKSEGRINLALFNVHPFYSFLVIFGIIFMHHFISLYGGGYSLQGRIFNISFMMFMLALSYFLINWIVYFDVQGRLEKKYFRFAVIVIMFLSFFSQNDRFLIAQVVRDLPSFHKELKERYRIVEEAKAQNRTEVTVARIKTNPRLFCLGEYKPDSSAYNSRKLVGEMSRYYKIKIALEE
jgi:hypothetical protein